MLLPIIIAIIVLAFFFMFFAIEYKQQLFKAPIPDVTKEKQSNPSANDFLKEGYCVLTSPIGRGCQTIYPPTIAKVTHILDETHIGLSFFDFDNNNRKSNISNLRLPHNEFEKQVMISLYKKADRYEYAKLD